MSKNTDSPHITIEKLNNHELEDVQTRLEKFAARLSDGKAARYIFYASAAMQLVLAMALFFATVIANSVSHWEQSTWKSCLLFTCHACHFLWWIITGVCLVGIFWSGNDEYSKRIRLETANTIKAWRNTKLQRYMGVLFYVMLSVILVVCIILAYHVILPIGLLLSKLIFAIPIFAILAVVGSIVEFCYASYSGLIPKINDTLCGIARQHMERQAYNPMIVEFSTSERNLTQSDELFFDKIDFTKDVSTVRQAEIALEARPHISSFRYEGAYLKNIPNDTPFTLMGHSFLYLMTNTSFSRRHRIQNEVFEIDLIVSLKFALNIGDLLAGQNFPANTFDKLNLQVWNILADKNSEFSTIFSQSYCTVRAAKVDQIKCFPSTVTKTTTDAEINAMVETISAIENWEDVPKTIKDTVYRHKEVRDVWQIVCGDLSELQSKCRGEENNILQSLVKEMQSFLERYLSIDDIPESVFAVSVEVHSVKFTNEYVLADNTMKNFDDKYRLLLDKWKENIKNDQKRREMDVDHVWQLLNNMSKDPLTFQYASISGFLKDCPKIAQSIMRLVHNNNERTVELETVSSAEFKDSLYCLTYTELMQVKVELEKITHDQTANDSSRFLKLSKT